MRLSGSLRQGGTVGPAGASLKNFNGLSLSLSKRSQDQIEVIHLAIHSLRLTHSLSQLGTHSVSRSVSQSVSPSFISTSCPSVSFRFVSFWPIAVIILSLLTRI